MDGWMKERGMKKKKKKEKEEGRGNGEHTSAREWRRREEGKKGSGVP
jgi:hypothetical protein